MILLALNVHRNKGLAAMLYAWSLREARFAVRAAPLYSIHRMLEKLTAFLSHLPTASQYIGVFLLMALQSACIPIPSEVIMPFAGALLAHSQMDLVLLATLASLASNLGSVPAYWAGAKGGRPMVERYGSYVLLGKRELDMVDHFFSRFGSITVLIGRMLPIIRTFIAFPAGIARMNKVRFHLYTFIGSWPWCYALAYAGMRLGRAFQNDPRFQQLFHRFHLAVEAVLLIGILWFLWTHWKNRTGAGAIA
jgi:membrane protein DedA with SNARE-associated domain